MTARRDPIVEEVRKHRAVIAAEHGNRLEAILKAFQREEEDWPAGTVSRPPKVLATHISKNEGPRNSTAQQAAAPDDRASRAVSGHW